MKKTPWLTLGLIWAAGAFVCASAQDVTEEVRDKLQAATVFIETTLTISSRDWNSIPDAMKKTARRPEGDASGSGFVITADGYIITNAHVVQGFTVVCQPDGKGNITTTQAGNDARHQPFDPAQPKKAFTLKFTPTVIKVVLFSGEERQKKLSPKIIRIRPSEDLALLKIPTSEALEFLESDSDSPIMPGTPVLMAGFPGGKLPDIAPFARDSNLSTLMNKTPRMSINSGMVSAIREYKSRTVYQLDIRANHGNSGGPICNFDGRVVGVLYAGIDELQSINYALPIKGLKSILPSDMESSSNLQSSPESGAGNQSFDDFLNSGSFSFDKKSSK